MLDGSGTVEEGGKEAERQATTYFSFCRAIVFAILADMMEVESLSLVGLCYCNGVSKFDASCTVTVVALEPTSVAEVGNDRKWVPVAAINVKCREIRHSQLEDSCFNGFNHDNLRPTFKLNRFQNSTERILTFLVLSAKSVD